MAMTTITTTTALATTEVVALTGVTRIALGEVAATDTAVIYEQRADDEYYPVRAANGGNLTLTIYQPSVILEGYGNYKVVTSRADLEVGYVAG